MVRVRGKIDKRSGKGPAKNAASPLLAVYTLFGATLMVISVTYTILARSGGDGDGDGGAGGATNVELVANPRASSIRRRGENAADAAAKTDTPTNPLKGIGASPTEKSENTPCSYRKLSDLSSAELTPMAGDRYIVQPPSDDGGTVALVCCRTTAGPLSIAVHTNWAPLGARQFLEMVESSYFSSRVPFMRCIRNWLCQFGIAGEPEVDKLYKNKNLQDDPQWLPKGPDNRQRNGVKRFARGYLAYAGSGKNSRSNQFIVALKNDGPLGGGSPWEVPWGELVGDDSYATLSKIYTGYGEKGPPQGTLHNQGASREVREKWPHLDYIASCEKLDEIIWDSNYNE